MHCSVGYVWDVDGAAMQEDTSQAGGNVGAGNSKASSCKPKSVIRDIPVSTGSAGCHHGV